MDKNGKCRRKEQKVEIKDKDKDFLQVAILCILDFPLWIIDGIRLRVPYCKKERCLTKILNKSVARGFIPRSGDADINYCPPAEMIQYVFLVIIDDEEVEVLVNYDQYRNQYIGDEIEIKYLRRSSRLRAVLA